MEAVRRSLRDLVELIPRQQVKPLYTQFSDTLAQVKEVMPTWGGEGVDRARYRQKIEQFIRDNGDMVAIYKIRHAMPLNQEDIPSLTKSTASNRSPFSVSCFSLAVFRF